MNRVQATLASIAHWRENAAAEHSSDASIGVDSCALCALYNRRGQPKAERCVGCPVLSVTGKKYCRGSPQEDAWNARHFWLLADDSGQNADAFRAAANAEADWLEQVVLPKAIEMGDEE